MAEYRAIIEVLAVQWTGHNLDEMKELLKDVVQHNQWDGPEVYSDYVEPYHIASLGTLGGYSVLKFYAGDDMEVDPGQWVVVYEDGEVEIMDEGSFARMGFVKK